MIYATVGTMFLDFERLVRAMDEIAAATGERVVLQVGMGKVRPEHCEFFDFKSRDEVLALQREARVIVSHAGIGSVLDALSVGRPLIVVPRLKRYGEHMNDHQLDIAEAVERRGWGRMVLDMAELAGLCANPPEAQAGYAPAEEPLIATVRTFVEGVAERKRARGRG